MAGYDPKQPRDDDGRWTSEGVSYSEGQGYFVTKKNAAGQDVGIPRAAGSKNDAERIRKEFERQRKGWEDPAVLAAREAAGLAEIDFHQQRMQLIEKARTEAGLSKGQIQGWERVRVSKEYGGGSGFIYELSEDANFARIHKKPDGQGEFLGYYHLSSLLPFK